MQTQERAVDDKRSRAGRGRAQARDHDGGAAAILLEGAPIVSEGGGAAVRDRHRAAEGVASRAVLEDRIGRLSRIAVRLEPLLRDEGGVRPSSTSCPCALRTAAPAQSRST